MDDRRVITAQEITETVARLCVEANYQIAPDIRGALSRAARAESGEPARGVLACLLDNADIASRGELPLCQDTGLAVVFAEVGQEVRIEGGSFAGAIEQGVRDGYVGGCLRKSVVRDPIDRVNTGDNTPCFIHTEIVPGDRLRLTVAPKGAGSENMSALAMLKPSQGIDGVKEFVVDTVRRADSNPCPPIIVGVGVGGTFEIAALSAKRALLREVGAHNADPSWAEVERELLRRVNELGIGPAGLGGTTTALAVNIEVRAAHIASLPVAVNIGCHSTRHASALI